MVVVPLALVAACLSVRAAVGTSGPDSRLASLRGLFAGHQNIAVDDAMTAVGNAARTGQPLNGRTRAQMRAIAVRDPLRPEPYLAVAAQTLLDDDPQQARALLLAARARDPRSLAARFLLADSYLKAGEIEPGLSEMAALARLRAAMAQPLIPAIAAYAQQPGAVPKLRAFFARDPEMRDGVMSLLATDARNAGLLTGLAQSLPMPRQTPVPDWQSRIVTSLVQSGQVPAAARLWSLLSGRPHAGGVVDPTFSDPTTPPPFAWTYQTGSEGVAEAAPSGGMSVIYYGRARTELARQNLALPSGPVAIRSETADRKVLPSLRWTLLCAQDNKEIGSAPIGGQATVMIPTGCQGPVLTLVGIPSDFPAEQDARIVSVTVEAAR